MTSPTARLLIRILAVLYAALGLILFFFPVWSSQNFAWKVSPWVVMTIGGWCLGNAYFAWKASKIWRWSAIYPNLIYLWSFGILQTLVLIFFSSKLLIAGPASWLYLITLAVNLLCAGFGIREWLRHRPVIKPEGEHVATWVRGVLFSLLFFTIVVTTLAILNADLIVRGEVMPESISLFSIYAFAMFYLSLVISGLTITRSKGSEPVQQMAQGAVALIIPTTIAAMIFFANEDAFQELGAFLYIALYLLILLSASSVVVFYNKLFR